VDPDQVLGLDQGRELRRHARIHAPVAFDEGRIIDREVEPIMEGRPQDLVREPEIVGLVVAARQRHRCRSHPVLLGELEAELRLVVDDGPVPSEPDPAPQLQRFAERHGKPTRLDALLEVDDPVGGNDQAAHSIDSQGFDRRMAPLMIPTIE
jgi:hypothetical protein